MKLNAKSLRSFEGKGENQYPKNNIYIILDNVLDTYNIGSIFRLADAVGANKILLCGGTETPPNHKIKKASINTTNWVEWEYFPSTLKAIEVLRKEVPGVQIYAIEQSENSKDYKNIDYKFPQAFIVGHESYGVSKEVLDIVDETVELPMYGVNVSLNVMVSLGIVLYHALFKKI